MFFLGVVFEDMLPGTSLPPHVRYKIRQNATFTPTTKYVRKQTWYPGPGPGTYPYYQFGFVWVQVNFSAFLHNQWKNNHIESSQNSSV